MNESIATAVPEAAIPPSALNRLFDSDIAYSFRRSPGAVISAFVLLAFAAIALLAPWLAPQNPFDPAALNILDARLPPAWIEGGQARFPLGTDGQGRDLASVLMYGLRISLLVSFCATLFALVVGVTLGLVSGYAGGWVDQLIMRVADMQLSFPTILVALLIALLFVAINTVVDLLYFRVDPRVRVE